MVKVTSAIQELSKEQWSKAMSGFSLEIQDVYFSSEYYSVVEDEKHRAICLFYQEADKKIMYPFLKTHINAVVDYSIDFDCYDIEGAYGYNGFLSNSTDAQFMQDFSEALHEYCLEKKIVAEFLRLNPLFTDYSQYKHMEIISINKNIVIDLTLPLENIWMESYEHCVRKNVKKAQRHGITFRAFTGDEITADILQNFFEIYTHTMERNSSDEVYYFSREYFKKLAEEVGEKSLFVFAMKENKPISCELVILSQENAYSFLGGTIDDFQEFRPNNFIKHETVLLLKKMKYKKYCLGGGRTMDDGIYRYKKTFARRGDVKFFIAKKVHQPDIYNQLCVSWAKRYPEKMDAYKNYFLKYKS